MKYICQICGYVYDDDVEKVPFEQLPDDWTCPLCGAAKSDFRKEEPLEKPKQEEGPIESDDVPLNAGELSTVCSNLARGCEKQYMPEEAKLFKELADYFDRIRPSETNHKVEDLISRINADIEEYPLLKDYCLQNEDRGAARVGVWGERVSRMLITLLNRYQQKGEAMLEGTKIWVCSVCGFVYVGDEPPRICPVCKVPDWKFEEVGGAKR
ncbi:MAG: rubredoxin [Bacilli bacterium]|nr:rubredoxin [Bacilli bacterium]